MVILTVVAIVLVRNGIRTLENANPEQSGNLENVQLRFQGRYLIGVAEFGLPLEPILEQGQDGFAKTPMHELAWAILEAYILEDDTMGLLLADQVETKTDDEAWAKELLVGWYDGEQLSEEDRTWLVNKLGWFGELALAHGDAEKSATINRDAKRMVMALLVGVVLGLIGFMIGLVLLSFAAVAPSQGWVTFIRPSGQNAGIYAETFALYLVLFVGGSWLLSFGSWGRWGLGVMGLLILSTLVALVWPVMRGVPWATVREEMGLRFRWADVPLGIATEMAALPLLLAGALVMFGVMRFVQWRLGQDVGQPTHPLGDMIDHMTFWVAVQIFFVAAFCAPLVEEIFFRGALYTNLSQLAHGWQTAARVGSAALLSSFLFAVIHPQGWLGTLVLTPLAMTFALVREARGSVWPGVVAHMIHNGSICALVVFLLG
jgi:membrane protease YdiL (CAAX protease family)